MVSGSSFLKVGWRRFFLIKPLIITQRVGLILSVLSQDSVMSAEEDAVHGKVLKHISVTYFVLFTSLFSDVSLADATAMISIRKMQISAM